MNTTAVEYNDFKRIAYSNKKQISEHLFGGRRTIYVEGLKTLSTLQDDSTLDVGELEWRKFCSFLAAFNRNIYNQIRKNQDLMTMELVFDGCTREKNHTVWNGLKEFDVFYTVDMKSAYWQMAHKLGYISTNMFEKYMHRDEYRHAKRLCISFMARENKMVYTNSNGSKRVITCDTGVLYRAYNNIRHELYACTMYLIKGNKKWLGYNIDAVSILPKHLSTVEERMQELGLLYEVKKCQKIDEKTYFCNNKQRKF